MSYDIGVFDSGLGGLTVFKKLKAALPGFRFAYLADSKRCPYGIKSPDSIQEICKSNLKFFQKLEAKVVVIACHTASTNAYDFLKTHFQTKIIPIHLITGNYLLNLPLNSSLLILGTQSTIKNGYYQSLLDSKRKDLKVEAVGCPLLVEYIQNQINDEKILSDILSAYQIGTKHFDYVLLACTHFPIVQDFISARFGIHSKMIDPADLVTQLFLSSEGLLNASFQKDDFFVYGNPLSFDLFASKLLNHPINSQCVDLEDCVKI